MDLNPWIIAYKTVLQNWNFRRDFFNFLNGSN